MTSPLTKSIAVVGAGIAGCSAAIALRRAGLQVVLFGGAPQAAPQVGETLPSAARRPLADLGVWEAFRSDGHVPSSGTVSVWGDASPHFSDSIMDPLGGGWQVDRLRFGDRLRSRAVDCGCVFHEGAVIAGAERTGEGWTLQVACASGTWRAEAGYVVDGSGRRGAVARAGGATRRYSDGLMCRHARFAGPGAAKDADTRTWVESVPEGWWYSARVPGGRRVVAFLTDGDLMPESTGQRRGFADLLQRTVWIRRLVKEHGLELVDGPHTSAARSSRFLPAAGDGWIAVGDAALAFDPLSGRGMWSALVTGLWAADEIANGARAPYRDRLDTLWTDTEGERLSTYAREPRWPGAAFWMRRQNAFAGVAAALAETPHR